MATTKEEIKTQAVERFKKESETARAVFNGLVAGYPVGISKDADPVKTRQILKEHYEFLSRIAFSASRVFNETATIIGTEKVRAAVAEFEATQSTE